MRTLALVAAATFMATSAIAQTAYQGSGQRAGGPARLLNSETGGVVKRAAKPNVVPSYQRGSGQRAGGPANELNRAGTATLSTQGTIHGTDRVVPFRQSGSGQRAGGPYQR